MEEILSPFEFEMFRIDEIDSKKNNIYFVYTYIYTY